MLSNSDGDYSSYEPQQMKLARAAMARYRPLIADADEQSRFDALGLALNHYADAVRQVVQLSRDNAKGEALQVVRGASRQDDFEAMDLIGALVSFNETGSAGAIAAADASYLHSRRLVIGPIVASALAERLARSVGTFMLGEPAMAQPAPAVRAEGRLVDVISIVLRLISINKRPGTPAMGGARRSPGRARRSASMSPDRSEAQAPLFNRRMK